MKHLYAASLACLLTTLPAIRTVAEEPLPEIRMASLEWPPYTGSRLADSGSNAKHVIEAFRRAGYTLKIDFLPWSRAVAKARDPASGYAGYFPEYYSSLVERDFIFSDITGSGPLGLARQKSAHIEWKTLWDLRPYRLGVVQDYVNTAELDGMISRRELMADTAVSDTINLRKLGAGRLDLVVIDKNVFAFLMQTEPTLAPYRDSLVFDGHRLEEKGLYIAWRREGADMTLIKALNRVLGKMEAEAAADASSP